MKKRQSPYLRQSRRLVNVDRSKRLFNGHFKGGKPFSEYKLFSIEKTSRITTNTVEDNCTSIMWARKASILYPPYIEDLLHSGLIQLFLNFFNPGVIEQFKKIRVIYQCGYIPRLNRTHDLRVI
jgi:hypothetical protein